MKPKTPRFKRKEICAKIRDLIKRENLSPGDRIGSERELAEKMNVQRLTVRRAIKKLCGEGLLEQRPKSGTYIRTGPEQTGSQNAELENKNKETLFAPTSSILTIRRSVVIKFVTDDSLPEQLQSWDRVIRFFNETFPDITVNHIPIGHNTNSDCDCALVRPHDLHDTNTFIPRLKFPESWYKVNTIDSFLSTKLVNRINNYTLVDEGYYAIPILLTFPVHVINRDLLEKYGQPIPPSQQPWRKTRDWLKNYWEIIDGVPSNPYTHSPLNHLCRHHKNILTKNHVDIHTHDVKEFLKFMKILWNKCEFSLEKPGTKSFTDDFIKSKVLSLEAFLHIIPIIGAQNKGCLKVAFHSLSSDGMIQVLPRFIILGSNRDTFYETLEFIRFLVSVKGQNMLTEEGLGIPYYNGKEGAKLFCDNFPVDFDELKAELSQASGFYDNLFFMSDFQERIINPMLQAYFLDEQSLDRTIANIRTRTWQIHDLFFSKSK